MESNGNLKELKKRHKKTNTRKKHVIKGYRQLLVQMGLIIFLFFGLTLVALGIVTRNLSTKLFLEAKDEKVEEALLHLRDKVETVPQLEGVVGYWSEYPKEILLPMTEDEQAYMDEFYRKGKEWYTNELDFYQETPEHQKAMAKNLYYWPLSYFVNEQYAGNFDLLYYMDISRDDFGKIYVNGNADYTNLYLGITSKVLGGHYKDFAKVRGNSGEDTFYTMVSGIDGKEWFVGFAPVRTDGGRDTAVVIGMDWSSFSAGLNDSILTIQLIFAGILALAGGFILLTLYFTAVWPVKTIQQGIRSYMAHNDSEGFIRNMHEIQSNNEFGALADDLSELTVSLENYSQENILLERAQAMSNAERQLASKMQNDMLPKAFPEIPEAVMAAVMIPARDVGGDFYDVFMIDDTHMVLVIADVAGKGTPAALLGTSAQTSVRHYARMGMPPEEILANLNNEICEKDMDSMFVTIWVGIMDITTGDVKTANAGHEYPLIRTGGNYILFRDQHEMPVGSVEDRVYIPSHFRMFPGDELVVYTDGFPEAINAEEELYGMNRMIDELNTDNTGVPKMIISNLILSVQKFAGETEQFDDMTILCLRYNGPRKEN